MGLSATRTNGSSEMVFLLGFVDIILGVVWLVTNGRVQGEEGCRSHTCGCFGSVATGSTYRQLRCRQHGPFGQRPASLIISTSTARSTRSSSQSIRSSAKVQCHFP
jgi:hypothetical protein